MFSDQPNDLHAVEHMVLARTCVATPFTHRPSPTVGLGDEYQDRHQKVSINSLLEVKRLPKTTCWKVLVEGMSKLSHQTCTVQSPHFTSFHPLVVGGHAASISVSGSEDLSEPANIYQVGPPGTWERIWVIPSTSAFDWLKTPPDSHDHHDPPLV